MTEIPVRVVGQSEFYTRGPSSVQGKLVLNNGLVISVWCGNITAVEAEAVVAGEDSRFSGRGAVARALLRAGGGAYQQKRNQIKDMVRKEDCNFIVYRCPGGPGLKNKQVFHAILDPSNRNDPHGWSKHLEDVFFQVGFTADNAKVASVAMPLLGAGNAGGDMEVSLQAAVRGLSKVKPTILGEVILVEFTPEKAAKMKHRLEKIVSSTNPEQKSPPDRGGRIAGSGPFQARTTSSTGAGSHPLASGEVDENGWVKIPEDVEGRSDSEPPPAPGKNPANTSGAQTAQRADSDDANIDLSFFSGSSKKSFYKRSQNQDLMTDRQKDRHIDRQKPETDANNRGQRKRMVDKRVEPASEDDVGKEGGNRGQRRQTVIRGAASSSTGSPREELPVTNRDLGKQTVEGGTPTIPTERLSEEGGDRVQEKQTAHEDGPATSGERPVEGGSSRGQRKKAGDDDPPAASRESPPTQGGNRGQRKRVVERQTAGQSSEAGAEGDTGLPERGTTLWATGTMPPGTMLHSFLNGVHLPGHQDYGVILVDYVIADGVQGPQHPQPGSPHSGCAHCAFLPDNGQGRQVLSLLGQAFERRLTFQVCVEPDGQAVVEWTDIPHKTLFRGDREGYPDPDYLTTVQDVLREKYGIE